MIPNVLIIGPPQSGKTTLIKRLFSHYKETKIKIHGFITPEVREGEKRIGFDIEDLRSHKRYPLARVGKCDNRFKVGKYCVFLEDFERFLKRKFKIKKSGIIFIDEIGKMELMSLMFQGLIKEIFRLDIPIIATMGSTLQHPVKDYLLHYTKILQFKLNKKNQEEIFKEIIQTFI